MDAQTTRRARAAVVGVVAAWVLLAAPPVSASATAPVCADTPAAEVPGRPWAQQRLDYERVWPISTGQGVRVAVIDSGVDAGHPRLAGRVETGFDLVINAPGGNTDNYCHGTFVAGIIAARQVGAGFGGVAPGVTIIPLRETNSDHVDVQLLAAGIRRAADVEHAQVINISTVTTVDAPALRDAVNDALRHNVLIVAAAGNNARAGDPPQYPANYPGVLSVGAIASDGSRADFSQRTGVGLVAPGKDVLSVKSGDRGNGLVGIDGTSFAAPFVSGVAALVMAYHPELSAPEVLHRLEATADHPAAPLPDPQFGWGVVNPYAAVTAILPEEAHSPLAHPTASAIALPAVRPSVVDSRTQVAQGLALMALTMVLIGAFYLLMRTRPAN